MRKITSILLLAWLALAGIMNAQSLPFTPATISNGKFNPGTQYYYITISEDNPSKYLYIDGNDVKMTTTKGQADQFAITGNTNVEKIEEGALFGEAGNWERLKNIIVENGNKNYCRLILYILY